MLEYPEIENIVREVAIAKLKQSNVVRVMTEPAVDSEGQDAVRVTIVIQPEAIERIKGGPVLDTLVGIRERLRKSQEERLPIIEYATEQELSASDDPER